MQVVKEVMTLRWHDMFHRLKIIKFSFFIGMARGHISSIHSKKSRRKGGQGRIKKFVGKMRYVNRDSVARPARRCQLKCLFEMKDCDLSH